MALGELAAVRSEDHRHVGEGRRLRVQRPVDVDLARRVVEVVVAANHVGDAHVHVVHDHGEIVGGHAVRAHEDDVVEFLVVKLHVAVYLVLDHDDALVGIPETNDGLDARHRLGPLAAASVVARLLPSLTLGRPHGVQLFLAAIAVVGLALGDQLFGDLGVAIEVLRLVERPDVGTQLEPLHPVQDDLDRLLRGSFPVGVLDPQHEGAAMLLRVQPREQRRAHAADVEESGGTGSESGLDGHST